MATRPFYDTIEAREEGKLPEYNRLSAKQEALILSLFKDNRDLELTPFEVQRKLKLENTPITSIRRAMTNLANKGHLIKTLKKAIETYGKPNHKWRYAEPEYHQDQLFNTSHFRNSLY